MGSCVSSQNKKQLPAKPLPVHHPEPEPIKKHPAAFSITRDGKTYFGMRTDCGLALAPLEVLRNKESCSQVKSEVSLAPEKFFLGLDQLNIALVAMSETLSHPPPRVMCKLLKTNDVVDVDRPVQVQYANQHHIFYAQEEAVPGTPILCDENLVGVHERKNRGVNMVWIVRTLKELGSFGTEAPMIMKFLDTAIEDPRLIQPAVTSMMYSLFRNTLVSYNLDTDEFLDHHPNIPKDAQLCYVPTGVLITGGINPANQSIPDVSLFDGSLSQLVQRPAMSVGRVQHSLCLLKQCVYALSGQTDHGVIVPSCERFSLRKSNWEPISPMFQGRRNAGAVEFHSRIYVIGGVSSTKKPVLEAEFFENEVWTQVRFSFPAFENKVLVASDMTSIWLLSQRLWKWVPEDNQCVELREPLSDFPGDALRIRDTAVYVFKAMTVYEGRVSSETVTWTKHQNEVLANFI